MVSDVISSLLNNYESPLVYYHNTSQFCRTHLDNVSRIKMTTLSFILSELPSLMVNATMPFCIPLEIFS